MAKRFEDYTFQDAAEVLGQLKQKLKAAESNRLFIEGDDWQNGSGWVGPQFDSNTKVGREIKNAIEKGIHLEGLDPFGCQASPARRGRPCAGMAHLVAKSAGRRGCTESSGRSFNFRSADDPQRVLEKLSGSLDA